MPIIFKKLVELQDVADAVNNRRTGAAINQAPVEQQATNQEKLKTSYFLIDKESDYLDHNRKHNRR